jgi:FdhE protein
MSNSLEALVREHPDAATAAAALRALASTLPDATLPEGVPHLGAARTRLEAGLPALEGDALLSGAALVLNVRALVHALERTAGLDLDGVADELERGLDLEGATELAAAALGGEWPALTLFALSIGVEQDTMITLVDHACRPALRAGAKAVAPLLRTTPWDRGVCPACGAPPLLGELRGGGISGGAEHERVLRCGRCVTAWPFPRLQCTRCGETNHRCLSYLHAANEESFRRAEVCSTCHSYLKNIAVLSPLDVTELMTADLSTAALDIAAIEQGYHR